MEEKNTPKEYTIALTLVAPNKESAKRVADEAQSLIDEFGGETFLRAVEFIKNNPSMLRMALNMIGVK